ncbi:MAG: LacI family DNA-binding transcriptional regulator [Opitutaceae bacterium]|nr:LacI family DNA-binding transcriptional regulator [Opitutaceae bacterium]
MTRVTQLDIARKAGVGRSTVSFALKNHPGLASETKQHILRVAEELGYVPDPMLSALAIYRSNARPKSFQGTLAWLVNSSHGTDWGHGWDEKSPYGQYFAGSSERAKSHGYQIEKFILDANLPSRRLSSILRARNITGILLCPQARHDMEMDFPWESFAVVTFGYSLIRPCLHTVASAHYLNTRHAIQELVRRGYRRIGLVTDQNTDLRCGSNVCAGFLVEQLVDSKLSSIPPCYIPFVHDNRESAERLNDAQKLRQYIGTHKLDAIVTSDYHLLTTLKMAAMEAPRDVGVAGLSLQAKRGRLSGVVENSLQLGSVAVDLLVGMVSREERGLPKLPIRTHVEGSWFEGQSLR